jgi:hypothetical protein
MITVATFSKPEDAHLLRLRLGAGGVDAYVQDENMVQMNWLYSNAIGGVRVQIAETDLEAAREIAAAPPVGKGDAAEVSEEELAVCPGCSSTNTAPDERPRRLAFLSMIFSMVTFGVAFPFAFLRRRWKCADCGHTWKPERN